MNNIPLKFYLKDAATQRHLTWESKVIYKKIALMRCVMNIGWYKQ